VPRDSCAWATAVRPGAAAGELPPLRARTAMPMTPRPPQRPSGGASARSSRENLAGNQQRAKLCSLIELRAQLDFKASGRTLGPKARARLHRAAKQQAASLANTVDGAEALDALPDKVSAAAFRPGALDAKLVDLITEAAAACGTLMSAPPTPMPTWEAAAPAPPPAIPEQQAANQFVQKRLPQINVAGKAVPLEKLIQDKVMQCGAGGAHQLRKMFQAFDLDGSGTVSIDEMDRFLRSNNIKVNKETLSKFFDTWAGDKVREDLVIEGGSDDDDTTLNYMEFIEKILPADYPQREERSQFAEDLASLARNEKNQKKKVNKTEIASFRDFQLVFQEKIQAKSPGGGAELRRMFALFDNDKKGYVTFDDLMEAASRWNVTPTARVKKECFIQWSIPEDGRVTFDDFIAHVLPQDFRDVKSLQAVFWSRISQEKNLRDVFRRIDVDKSGTIDADEIIGELRKMHVNVTYEMVHKLVQTFDEDSDGEIDFLEFSRAMRSMDPDQNKAKGHGSAIGMLWEADPEARRRIEQHRPHSSESIRSVVADPRMLDDFEEKTADGFVVDNNVHVQEDGSVLVNGNRHDFVQLLRAKIYEKYRCGGNPLRKMFKAMDKDNSGKISLGEFKKFLELYNLHLSKEALFRLVQLFDVSNDGMIDYVNFCAQVDLTADDYDKLKMADGSEEVQGIAAMVHRPKPVFADFAVAQIKADDPFESKSVPTLPGDARAINMIREKVAQRARNVNDNSAAIQLRDALQLYDTQKNGKLPRSTFREILERYSVYLQDREFDQLCQPLTSVGHPNMVAYKPFLEKVLQKPHTSGAFGKRRGPATAYAIPLPGPWSQQSTLFQFACLACQSLSLVRTIEVTH
jgi:Ca2+-binding EF-hand superfamily protein